MTVDEIVKLIVFGGITFSIVGISIQIMRILGRFSDMLGDTRATIKNVGKLTDQVVEDYSLVSSALRSIASGLGSFNTKVIQPLTKISDISGKFFGKNKEKKEE